MADDVQDKLTDAQIQESIVSLKDAMDAYRRAARRLDGDTTISKPSDDATWTADDQENLQAVITHMAKTAHVDVPQADLSQQNMLEPAIRLALLNNANENPNTMDGRAYTRARDEILPLFENMNILAQNDVLTKGYDSTKPAVSGQTQAQQVEVTTINGKTPEESAELMAKIQRIESVMLGTLVPAFNDLDRISGLDVSISQKLTMPAHIQDGIWQQDSRDAYNSIMQHAIFLTKAQENPGDAFKGNIKKDGYNISEFLNDPKSYESLKKAIDTAAEENPSRYSALQAALPDIYKDLKELQAEGLLDKPFDVQTVMVPAANAPQTPAVTNTPSPSVNNTTGNPSNAPASQPTTTSNTPPQTDDTAETIGEVKNLLNMVMTTLPDQIGGGIADMDLSQFGIDLKGIKDGVLSEYTFTEDELKNGEFGQKANKILSTAVIGLKMMSGVDPANGEWDGAAQEAVRKMLYTSPAAQGLRDKIKAGELDGVPPFDIPQVTEEQYAADQKNIAKFKDLKAQGTITPQQEALLQGLENKYVAGNLIVGGIDERIQKLKDKQLIDEEYARRLNQETLMSRMAMQAIDDMGWGDAIRDFFKGEFGQMIKPFLEMFGIDLDFILGETEVPKTKEELSNTALTEASDNFNTALDNAQGNNVAEKVQNIIDDYEEKGSTPTAWIGKKLTGVLAGSKNMELVDAAIEHAMQEAKGAKDIAEAKQIFADSLKTYVNDHDIQAPTSQQRNADLNAAAGEVGKNDPAALDRARRAAAEANEQLTLHITHSQDVIDGKTNTDPKRFGDVTTMSQFLFENGEALSLDGATIAKLQDDQGNLDSMMTIEFCTSVQELWVRANAHAAQENGQEFGQKEIDDLEKFNPYMKDSELGGKFHKETPHLGIMREYIASKLGDDQAGAFEKLFVDRAMQLDMDYEHASDGKVQPITVWDQSYVEGEVDARWIAQDASPEEPNDEQNVVLHDDGDIPSDDPDDIKEQYIKAQSAEWQDWDPSKDGKEPCDYAVFTTNNTTNDVFVLIRNKDGDTDRGNDTYQKFVMEDYKNTKDIPDDVVKALMDNYDWSIEYDYRNNPEALTHEMKEDFIKNFLEDYFLCHPGDLEPVYEWGCFQDDVECSVGPAPDDKPAEQSMWNNFEYKHDEGLKRPEDFDGLPTLVVPKGDEAVHKPPLGSSNEIQGRLAAAMEAQGIDLSIGNDYRDDVNGYSKVMGYMRAKLDTASEHGEGHYMVFDLKMNGIDPDELGLKDGATPDAIVLSRDGVLSLVDYDKLDILPLDEQVKRPVGEPGNYAEDRRLDEILMYRDHEENSQSAYSGGFDDMWLIKGGETYKASGALYGEQQQEYKDNFVAKIADPRSSYLVHLREGQDQTVFQDYINKQGNTSGNTQASLSQNFGQISASEDFFKENMESTGTAIPKDVAQELYLANKADITGQSYKAAGVGGGM